MTRPQTPRFDAEPLIRIAATQYQPRTHDETITDLGKAANVLGIPASTFHRWRREGINYWQADRLAIRLGYHPSLIWEEWWHETKKAATQTPQTTTTHRRPRTTHHSPRTPPMGQRPHPDGDAA